MQATRLSEELRKHFKKNGSAESKESQELVNMAEDMEEVMRHIFENRNVYFSLYEKAKEEMRWYCFV